MNTQQIAAAIATHFDPSKSLVIGYNQTVLLQCLGTTLTEAEIIQLAGAPIGSEVTMQEVAKAEEPPGEFDPPQKKEVIPGGVLLTVTNQHYIETKNEVILFNDDDAPHPDSISIYIKLVRLQDRRTQGFGHLPKGIGALMVRSMLDGVRGLINFPRPFWQMSMFAAGGRNWGNMDPSGRRWAGYAVWPKYGFDMPLHDFTTGLFHEFPYFPGNLAACRTVSEVLGLVPGGPDFWAIVGDGWYMNFNMSPHSSSETCLAAYLGSL